MKDNLGHGDGAVSSAVFHASQLSVFISASKMLIVVSWSIVVVVHAVGMWAILASQALNSYNILLYVMLGSARL